jgi:polyphenol oxidase
VTHSAERPGSAQEPPAVHRDGPVRWVFSERHGGLSAAPYDSLNLGGHVGDDPVAVAANRARLAARLELAPTQVHYMRQVHGDRVRVVGESGSQDPDGGVDAQVTRVAGVALAVLVADCVPVLLADPVAGVVGAAHAGRSGVRAAVALRALEAMQQLGAEPGRTRAWLGPAVCPACYEVPEQMRADVSGAVPATWSTSASGTPALDLRAGLVSVLSGLGVTVKVVGPCTAESPDHFSYRRDRTTGRFAGVVWIDR